MDVTDFPPVPGGVTSASLCDAMARHHAHRCHAVGLVPARAGQVSAGPAATVRFAPRRDDVPDAGLAEAARYALDGLPPGALVVIAAPDAPGEAVAGGKKLAALEQLGTAGVVAWAAMRDRAEAAQFSMGTWALCETPRASGELLQVIDAGIPVALGGITICPGDWVYVDEAGLVAVPWGIRDEVIQQARGIEQEDAAAVRRIRGL